MADRPPDEVPNKLAKEAPNQGAAPHGPIDVIEDDGTLDGCGEPAVEIEKVHQKVAGRASEKPSEPTHPKSG